MKILLINPPIPAKWYNDEFYLPSSLLYLGAALQTNCDEVKIIDMKALKVPKDKDRNEFYDRYLINILDEFSPELIGFGCLFSGNFPDTLRFSIRCKEHRKDIPVVAGGIHFTIYAGEILKNCPSIDFIVMGEGEETTVRLANMLKTNRKDFASLDGFAYRENNEVKVNPKKRYIENLDMIPFPAYNLIDLTDYYVDTSKWHNPKNLPINTSIPIITSRSCPNLCNFCSMYMVMGPKWRPRTAINVVDEIEFLYNTYNHMHFSFMDDNMTLQKKRALDICSEITKRKLNIQFETPNGLNINTLDEEVLDALVSAGMVRISIAIESGSDFIRNKIMRKRLSRTKIIDTVKLTKQYPQLHTSAFFIMGMPEETQETLMDTYNLIKEIDFDKIHLMNIAPFPCTEVFEQAKKDGILMNIDTKDMYKADDLYFKNYERFFIKPYKLEVSEMLDFRCKCEELINKKTGKGKN
jgi:radical SAM superfamily enzyme YgiQ (UPF0313 family)